MAAIKPRSSACVVFDAPSADTTLYAKTFDEQNIHVTFKNPSTDIKTQESLLNRGSETVAVDYSKLLDDAEAQCGPVSIAILHFNNKVGVIEDDISWNSTMQNDMRRIFLVCLQNIRKPLFTPRYHPNNLSHFRLRKLSFPDFENMGKAVLYFVQTAHYVSLRSKVPLRYFSTNAEHQIA